MYSTKIIFLLKPKQKMEFTVLSYEPCTFTYLTPAPNVTEWEEITRIMKKDASELITDLKAQSIKVLTHYRGYMLYCKGGVIVYRYAPNSEDVNGHSYFPDHGTEEDVVINGQFMARVKYV
jgi:hypothetical protein